MSRRLKVSDQIPGVSCLTRLTNASRRLFEKWSDHLGSERANIIRNTNKIVCFDGDIEKPLLGLKDTEVAIIKEHVQIIIHSASSINLRAPLAKLISPIINASLSVAMLARECSKFERFVYISSAFSNAHCHDPSGTPSAEISETLHTLKDGSLTLETAETEYETILQFGDLDQSFESHFPWAYGYAKHLTERLLTRLFDNHPQRLLIVRPSIIGPAQSYPFPGYEVPGSAPLTMVAAAMLFDPAIKVNFNSSYTEPMACSHHDEVPVDVVVSRLIMHLVYGAYGIIHAVAGRNMRFSSAHIWQEIMSQRLLPWSVRVAWSNVHWDTNNMHPVARTFAVFGTSYIFGDDRTQELWKGLSNEERLIWPLFSHRAKMELSTRRPALKANLEIVLRKQGWPRRLVAFVCKRLDNSAQDNKKNPQSQTHTTCKPSTGLNPDITPTAKQTLISPSDYKKAAKVSIVTVLESEL